jgi:tetratricopeptide (TPR) repeat protein
MGVAKRNERATAEPWQALELDPNLAWAHAFMRLHALHLGGAEKIEGYIREAVRPSLFDSFDYFWFTIAGFSKNALGRYEEAIAWLRQGMSRNSTFVMADFHLGSALVHLVRMDQAHEVASAALALDPPFNLASFRAAELSDDPYYFAWRERGIDGLGKAGVPTNEAYSGSLRRSCRAADWSGSDP